MLGQPAGRRQRERGLPKDGRAEEMVHERNEFLYSPQRRVQRDLVEILDHDIVVVHREVARVVAASEERVRLAIPDAVHIDSVESHSRLSPFPGAAKKVHLVAARDNPAEDFPEVKLGSACLRILVVLPVENEYPH